MAIRDFDQRLRNLDSSDTTTPTPLTDSLINNDQFNYAHLIKFEKPTNDLLKGKTSRNANTYSYITDSAFDISWDDFSLNAKGIATGTQVYNANKLTKVGTVTETTDAKAGNISITLDSASLGASVSFAGIAVSSTTVLCQLGVDLVEEGFREGDKVELTTTNGAAGKGYAIIKEFQDNNRKFTYTTSAEGALVAGTENATKFHTISLASEEIHALILNKSHTTYTTYLNREVFIYKAHLDPDTNAIIGDPYLLFKGIIASGSIKEDPSKGSNITWGLTSHWGDFSRVSGRLTVDDAHRALDGNGEPDTEALIRPEYGSDLGFAHANQSLNVMATYNDIEIEYKQVDINGGWFGGKRIREVEVEVERRTDLAFNLSPKYLPVVYGVQKLDSIPIFVDTDNNDASQIYVAYAICEGPIAGILDLYVDGNSSICVDKADFDLRSTAGDTVDFVCKGRMDRGDALTGYDANTSTGVDGANYLDLWGNYGKRGPLAAAFRQANIFTQTYSSSSTAADSDTGILHEKTHTITAPLSGHFQVHVGKPDQKANPTLVGKAASGGFKIQNDYFDGDGEYWGNQHQLLDTAYTVGKFTIAAGETSIPEIDFIVRGKGVKCYNYDRSYNNTNSVVYTSAAKTNFNLGDTVALKRSSNNAVIAASVTIIDKWDFLDADGATQTRFITDHGTDIVNTHYMLKGSNKWHMSPDDTADDITSTVATPAKTTVTSSSANSAGNGVDVVLSNNAAFRAAIAAAIADAWGSVLTFNGISIPELQESEFRDIVFNASNNTLTAVGEGTVVSTLPDTVTEVFVKNAIILNSAHSQSDAYYAGKTITLTRFDSDDVPYIQVRTITSYTNSGNTAVVDSPWVAGFMPDAGDTYVISASKQDIRVSINPAMQLLDYLTSERYGRGLDLDLDIDLPTFKEAARLCDTRSKVTVAVPNSASVVVGDIYKYADPDDATIVHFRGTVESATARNANSFNAGSFVTGQTYTILSVGDTSFTGIGASANTVGTVFTATGVGSGTGTASIKLKEIVFKDVLGKLGHKYNTWESVRDNELIWHSTGNLYQTQAAGGYNLTAAHIITALNLARVSGTGDSTLALDVSVKSDNGNPLVKSFVPYSAGDTNGDFRGTGYTLYDSDDIKYWKYIGWDSNGQRNVTRHQMNQTVATANPIFDNVNLMLKQFNGILRYSNGKYQLDIRGQSPSTFVVGEVIEEADIIGSIALKDKGVKKTYNSVSTSIKDPQTKFESRSVSFFNSTYLKQDKSIPKKGSYGCPGITNYFNARFNINQMLDESRYGLTISFKMAPKGILLLPGSIIRLNYARFGWLNKEFRIASLGAGNDCLVNITADEHNNDAFLIKSLAEPAVGGTIAMGSVQNKNTPTAPTNLASNNGSGGVVLTWTNATGFDPATDTTEVWASSDTNNRADSTFALITTLSGAETFTSSEVQTSETTRYYWIRHRIQTNKSALKNVRAPVLVSSAYHPTSATAGIAGVASAPAAGASAKTASLSASSYAIVYAADGTTPSPSSAITLTASSQNFTNAYFKFTGDGISDEGSYTDGTGANVDTFTFSVPSTHFTAPKTIRVGVSEGNQTEVSFDSITIVATKPGVQGTDGDDGLKVVELNLYYQNAVGTYTLPSSAPTSGTYNFGTGVIASISSGWSQTAPLSTIGRNASVSTVLVTEASAGGGVSGSITWATPTFYIAGAPILDYIFQYASSAPSTPSATVYPALPSGWVTSIPSNPNDGKKLYSAKGLAVSGGSFPNLTFNYVWQTPVLQVQNKADVALGSVADERQITIFRQTSAPTALAIGDIWFDTDDGNKIYRAASVGANQVTAGEWISVLDDGATRARGAIDSSNRITGGIYDGSTIFTPAELLRVRGGFSGLDGTPILNVANANAALKNAGITMAANGTLTGGGSSVQVNLNSIPDAGNTRSGAARANAGLNGDGDVNRAVPQGRGGTGLSSNATLLNSAVTLTASGGTVTLNNAGSGSITKASIALGSVDNTSDDTIRAGNITGTVNNVAVATVSGGAVKANAGLAANGDVNRAVPQGRGGTGLSSNATLLNSAISISAAGALSGGGGGTVTATGVGAIKTDASNAPNTLKNNQVTLTASGGTVTLNNAGSGSITKASIALNNVTNDAQIKSDASNAPNSLKNDQVTLTASSGTVTLNNAGSGSITKASIALGSVDDTSDDTIRAGNITGTVGNVAVATVNTYGTTAGGSSSGNSRTHVNNNGLVVVDGSGNIRVKIGNLSAL